MVTVRHKGPVNEVKAQMRLINYSICVMTLLALDMATAFTFEVTSIADSGPGTLRDAVAMAADGDTINAFKIHGTIWLTNGEFFVDKSVVVAGSGPDRLALDGNTGLTGTRGP